MESAKEPASRGSLALSVCHRLLHTNADAVQGCVRAAPWLVSLPARVGLVAQRSGCLHRASLWGDMAKYEHTAYAAETDRQTCSTWARQTCSLNALR